MATTEFCSPLPEITSDEKRQLPEFKLEEYIAVERYRNPETLLRKPWTIYPLIANKSVDLTPQPVTPGAEMWADFRKGAIGELNYPRWAHSYSIGGVEHTVTLYHVIGENTGGEYNYRLLRCTCCLPDIRDAGEIFADYNPCPAKDMVIAERAMAYKQAFGEGALPPENAKDQVFEGALRMVMKIVELDPYAWPPSHRNDKLLLEGLAPVFGLPTETLIHEAKKLEENEVVVVQGEEHPTITMLT